MAEHTSNRGTDAHAHHNLASAQASTGAGQAGAVQEAETVRPIRALLRGLETLEALNRRDGLSVSEVAGATGLPRTTVYRILETLCTGGFAARDTSDERYRPTVRVRGLADGFADETWIQETAVPHMEALCRRILWPLMLSTFSGTDTVLRCVTDRMSPLALERYAPGATLSLTTSPAGIVRLAFARNEEHSALVALARAELGDGSAFDGLMEAAALAQERGYALDLRLVQGEAGVAVAVRDQRDAFRAIVCMRFIRSALTPERVASEFVPQLTALAATIGAVIPVPAGEADAMAPNAYGEGRTMNRTVRA